MKMIVGLGNPGNEYDNTRHNVGFRFLDKYKSSKNNLMLKKKFDGLYADFMGNGEKIIILFPLMYMNLSGVVVKKYVDYFNISLDDILIIQDDLDMKFGKIKLVMNSSSGGHNGIKNIEEILNSNSIKRLKIGISNGNIVDVKNFVTNKFNDDELVVLSDLDKIICNLLDDFLLIDFNSLMCKYNGINR